MKSILFILILSVSTISFANTITWKKVEIEQTYILNQTIIVNTESAQSKIAEGTKISLIEVKTLPMLKVKSHKYQLGQCTNSNLSTDLELVSIKQPNGNSHSVGINFTKGCVLDVYIDLDELEAISFLK